MRPVRLIYLVVRLVDLADIRWVDVRVLLDVAVAEVGLPAAILARVLDQGLVNGLIYQKVDAHFCLLEVGVGRLRRLFLLVLAFCLLQLLRRLIIEHNPVDFLKVDLQLL